MRRAPSRLIAGLRRVLSGAPDLVELTLTDRPEFELLHPVSDVSTLSTNDIPLPGVWSRLMDAHHIEETDLCARLADKTAGEGAPVWHAGAGGAPMFGVHICRLPSVFHTPEFGAVITEAGEVAHSTIAEALYFTPTLAALPGVRLESDGPKMAVAGDAPRLSHASIFLPWGARFNYGHFLLDGLAALAALEEQGLLETHPPIAPPLTPWQRELLALYRGGKALEEVEAPVVHIDDVVFASPMDHFLHAPNRLLIDVRSRILANVDLPAKGKKRLYLSRRNDSKRRLINELDLEAALVSRGFEIIFPEQYPVAEQISYFRDADVVVAPTGAALANVMFIAPSAKVFEIQPTNFIGIWVRGLCHLVDVEWFGFFAPSPLSETDISIEDQPRPGTLFSWKLDIGGFLTFLDKNL